MSAPRLLDRLLRRVGLQRTSTRSAFTGAQTGRLMQQWARQPLSADKELANDFLLLRGRARDLARNNPYAKRFVRMARAHVVGPKGVQFRPDVRFANGRPYDAVNEALEDAWEDFCRPDHCSASGRLSWTAVQRLAVSEWAAAGEALVLIRYDRRYRYGLALQPIDADRLDDSYSRAANARTGEGEIRMGVELDPDGTGRPVAYHILDVHPSEIGTGIARAPYRRRIPAEQVIHLFRNDERVELTRGIPELAVAMRDLRHLDGFQEAALVQARTSAAAMGFIVTKSPDGDVTTPDEGLEFSAEAGVVRELGIGQEFQSWDPNQPSDTFAGFCKAVLRSIAAGLGTSYAMLANDLSDANYSSMRTGRLEEQETWQELQSWFIDQFCERVFAAWFTSAVLSGRLSVPLSEQRDLSAHRWLARRWSSVDPVKDVEADERRIALGVTSRQAIAARDGEDLWEAMEHIAEEEAYAADLGIDITPADASAGVSNAGSEVAADAAANDAGGAGRGRGRPTGRGRRPDPDLAVVRSAG